MISATDLTLDAPAGPAEAVAYRHDDPRPGVLMLTDIIGIRPAQRQMAAALAEAGYTVLMPNVFYRTRGLPLFDFPWNFGEPRTMERLGELRGPLTPEAVAEDARAWVAALRGLGATGPLGVVGYCATGQVALRTAAACPEDVAAVASFHGGGLFTDAPTSPHRLLPDVRARLYFGFAVEDRSMPVPAIDGLKGALSEWGGVWASDVYDGARHGWTVPDMPAYHPEQAARAFERLTGLFSETL